jgi:site-specific DNA recombinase
LLDIVENKDIKIITPIIPFNQNEATVAKQISSVKAKLGRVKESYINGIDTLEEYKANKEKLEAEIAHLKELVVPEAKTKTVTVDVIRTVHDTITNAQSDSEKATAINSIVDHIIYDKEADTMEFFFVP